MRSETELRERLASEIVMFAGFTSKESLGARACYERIRCLTWALDPTEPSNEIPPMPGGNGAPDGHE